MENNLNSDSQLNDGLQDVINKSTLEINQELEIKTAKKRGRKPKDAKSNSLAPVPAQPVKMDKAQYKMGIQMGFSMFGMYMAKAFKYEGFNLTKDELEAIGESGAECAVHFMPSIDPKYVALGGFIMVSGGIYAMKASEYNEYLKAQKPKNDDGVKKD